MSTRTAIDPTATTRANRAVAILVSLTVLMWTGAELGADDASVALLLLGTCLVKGRLIIMHFMNLLYVKRRWRALLLGWLALVLGIIAATYLAGTH